MGAGWLRPASCYLDTTIASSWERLSGRHVVGTRNATDVGSGYPRRWLSGFSHQEQQSATTTMTASALTPSSCIFVIDARARSILSQDRNAVSAAPLNPRLP
jgi:hypothetical protein